MNLRKGAQGSPLYVPTKRELNLYNKPSRPWTLYRPPLGPPDDKGKYRRGAKRLTPVRAVSAMSFSDRVERAFANDNGGTWWAARTHHTVLTLEAMFAREYMPLLLYDVVGGMIAHPALEEEGYMYLQLGYVNDLVEVSLEDARVALLESVGPHLITVVSTT